jgi:hypothetical protein
VGRRVIRAGRTGGVVLNVLVVVVVTLACCVIIAFIVAGMVLDARARRPAPPRPPAPRGFDLADDPAKPRP